MTYRFFHFFKQYPARHLLGLSFPMLLVIVLDQLSKAWVIGALSEHQSVPLVPPFVYLTLVYNTGIAFGLFQGGAWFLIPLISLGVLALFFLALKEGRNWLHRLSFGLILGGALGNLADRWIRGAVVDFIDLRFWPVFNIADSGVTTGVGIFVICLLLREEGGKTGKSNHHVS